MPTYEIRISHLIVEAGSLEVEARNKFEAIAIAKLANLNQIEDWDFNDNFGGHWVSAVYSDEGSLTIDEDDDVAGAEDDDEEDANEQEV